MTVETQVVFPGRVDQLAAVHVTGLEDAWRADVALHGELDVANAPQICRPC